MIQTLIENPIWQQLQPLLQTLSVPVQLTGNLANLPAKALLVDAVINGFTSTDRN